MSGRPRRTPLSRGRVLQEAVALADESGLAAVNMRALAERLGVVPMALYKHVRDKEELLDGMVDAVIGEFDPPDPSLGWREGVRARVLSARRAVVRHPWARRAVESRTRRTPAVLGYMDTLAGQFRSGGLSVDLTHHVMHALGNRIWGFSPELFDESGDDGAPAPPQGDLQELAAEFASRYPHVLEIAVAATGGDLSGVGGGCDEQYEFEFALDLLLDGVQRLHERGWRPPGRDPVGGLS